MEVTSRKEKKFIIVSVTGRIDAITAPEFETYLAGLMTKDEKHFLVNLANLDYISSAGLRSILATAKKLKSDAGEIVFSGLRGPVEEVFKISGFHSIFKIFESEATALANLDNG
jgi:anti-anti-sigma factor